VVVALLARTSHRVSTAVGESLRPAVLVANRAPRRSATTTASPNSQQTQRILALRRPREERARQIINSQFSVLNFELLMPFPNP